MSEHEKFLLLRRILRDRGADAAPDLRWLSQDSDPRSRERAVQTLSQDERYREEFTAGIENSARRGRFESCERTVTTLRKWVHKHPAAESAIAEAEQALALLVGIDTLAESQIAALENLTSAAVAAAGLTKMSEPAPVESEPAPVEPAQPPPPAAAPPPPPPPTPPTPEEPESAPPAPASDEEAMNHDTIAVLHHAKYQLAKLWKADGSILAYDENNPKTFRLEEARVANIEELSALLTRIETDSQACVIRGRYVGDEIACREPDARTLRKGQVFRRKSSFADQPLHSVLIEVDDFTPVASDPVTEPVDAIGEYIATLPEPFKSASFHWQLSNSAGHPKKKGKLKVHLWFWLATPRTSAELKAWAKAIELPADKAVLDEVQIHYTAAPMFEDGVVDPVPARSGFVRGERDVVELDIAAVPVRERNPTTHVVSEDLGELRAKVAKLKIPEGPFSYQDFYRPVVFVIHSASGGSDEGLAIAREFDARYPHENGPEWLPTQIWPHAKADHAKGITIATLDKMLRDQQTPEERVAAAVSGFEEVGDAIVPSTEEGGELPTVRKDRLLPSFSRDEMGRIKPLINNVIMAVERPDICGVRLGFDTFRDEIMLARIGTEEWRPFTDEDYTVVQQILERDRSFRQIAHDTMRRSVAKVAREDIFDSAILWLTKIVPAWDGTPRIERFLLDYFGAEDTPYTRAVSRYWWTAHAGRVLVPGIQADMVPVLVGPQGIRKTSGVKMISPSPDYFTEIALDEVKDDDQARLLRGKLIGEIAELRGLRTRAAESIRSFITRTREHWIPKYREFATAYDRRLVFVGTTNVDEFLDDETGNRRWLPVEVSYGDTDAIERDRAQLWAEARETFKAHGLAFAKAEKLAVPEHEKFGIEDAWREPIIRWLATPDDPPPGDESDDLEASNGPPRSEGLFTINAVLENALDLSETQLTDGARKRVAKVLTSLGYRMERKRIGGAVKRVWSRKADAANLVGERRPLEQTDDIAGFTDEYTPEQIAAGEDLA